MRRAKGVYRCGSCDGRDSWRLLGCRIYSAYRSLVFQDDIQSRRDVGAISFRSKVVCQHAEQDGWSR